MRFSDKDRKLRVGSPERYPDSKTSCESYKKKFAPAEVTIDTLGRKNEKTFVLPARVKVSDLKAGVQAKVVKGRTLAVVSGRFELEEVPTRSK